MFVANIIQLFTELRVTTTNHQHLKERNMFGYCHWQWWKVAKHINLDTVTKYSFKVLVVYLNISIYNKI